MRSRRKRRGQRAVFGSMQLPWAVKVTHSCVAFHISANMALAQSAVRVARRPRRSLPWRERKAELSGHRMPRVREASCERRHDKVTYRYVVLQNKLRS